MLATIITVLAKIHSGIRSGLPGSLRQAAFVSFLLGSIAATSPTLAWHPKCGTLDATPERCCWSGTAPLCNKKCPSGYGQTNFESTTADGDLKKCVTGTHALCCPG